MTTKSGWCMAAPGARIPHEKCPGSWPRNDDITKSTGGLLMCGCDCHDRMSREPVPLAQCIDEVRDLLTKKREG